MTLWTITLKQPNRGPKGGRKPDIISIYHVLATGGEDALAEFQAQYPAQIDDDTQVSVAAADTRVVRGRA